jgi:hypothetical protein
MSAPVAQAVDAVRDLARAARSSNGALGAPQVPAERAAWLFALRQIVDAAEVAFTHVLADFDAARDGEVLHAASSTQSWLRGALGLASVDAAERVRIARSTRAELAMALASVVPSQPIDVDDQETGAGPADVDIGDGGPEDKADEPDEADASRQIAGRVSYEHVRSIHRTLRALPPSTRDEASETLTELAPQLGIDDLRATGRYLRHVLDPDGSARHAQEDFGRRWLSMAPLLDGMHSIDGVLDAESAARLNAALAPFLVPTGSDDTRTTDQRRADGLSEIVETAVKSGGLPMLSGSSLAIQVDVPLLTLSGGTSGPSKLSGTTRTPVWFTPDAAQRMACDASVRRLLLDTRGVALDLGRESRIFSSAQRKALAARDQGCRFPGCGRPPAHTDGHHLVPWARGGATDLSNGLLLCRFHHRRVHEGGWTITATSTDNGANERLTFVGPRGQRLHSPLPTARGPSP